MYGIENCVSIENEEIIYHEVVNVHAQMSRE